MASPPPSPDPLAIAHQDPHYGLASERQYKSAMRHVPPGHGIRTKATKDCAHFMYHMVSGHWNHPADPKRPVGQSHWLVVRGGMTLIQDDLHQPAPVVEEDIPTTVEEEHRSAPVEEAQQPAPVEETHQPAPVAEQHTPAPVEVAHQPAPVEEEHTPAPVEVEHTPAPVEEEHTPAPAPVEEEHAPAPVEATHQPAPVEVDHKRGLMERADNQLEEETAPPAKKARSPVNKGRGRAKPKPKGRAAPQSRSSTPAPASTAGTHVDTDIELALMGPLSRVVRGIMPPKYGMQGFAAAQIDGQQGPANAVAH